MRYKKRRTKKSQNTTKFLKSNKNSLNFNLNILGK